MRPSLQKPFNVHLSKHTEFRNYSNITKLEQERRERGFQVFISGANKERLKIRDLQQGLHAKKAQVNTNITLARKLKPPNNTFARRKFWQKSSEIKIKGSDGSKFALQNQKSPKSDISPYGLVLHDITSKTEFHPSTQKNSQLNLIRNRYKAYFHIDGYGFCCSKQTSKPSTPSKHQIDGASLIFNRGRCRHLKRIQNKHVCNSCSPQPYDNEEQKSQYYYLLDRNHECVNTLQEYLTPDYEYFQSAKEGTILDSYKGVANDVPSADSCNGTIYDVFYHKEKNIRRSARALLPMDNHYENDSERNEKYANDVNFQVESCLRESLPNTNVEKNEDEKKKKEPVIYQDERALVLLENQGSLDGLAHGNNRNQETEYLPPLGKALSPISKLVKSSNNHEEEKESWLVQKYQSFLNHDDKSSNNSIIDSDLAPENVDNGKRSSLKLNLRYLRQGLDYKISDKPTLDSVQTYVGDGTSTSSNDNGSTQTLEYSTTNSSTPSSNCVSPTYISGFDKLNPKPLIEEICKNNVDFSIVRDNNRKNRFSICPDRLERITKRAKLLSARVKKLDIKKQIYLSRILDKLDIVQVTRSVDNLTFCQHSPGLEESLLT